MSVKAGQAHFGTERQDRALAVVANDRRVKAIVERDQLMSKLPRGRIVVDPVQEPVPERLARLLRLGWGRLPGQLLCQLPLQ
jgi:hypothetical protein